MPAMRVLVDGLTVATLSPQTYGVMSASVSGTKIDEGLAKLHVSASNHPDGQASTYLIWVSELPLAAGQAVTVELLDDAPVSHAGKTIEELFSDQPAESSAPNKTLAEMVEELRLRPQVRNRFAFRLLTSNGTKFEGEAPTSAHGFGFSVLWNWTRPERVSASLHTYTLEGLLERTPVNDLVREYISVGGWVCLELVGEPCHRAPLMSNVMRLKSGADL